MSDLLLEIKQLLAAPGLDITKTLLLSGLVEQILDCAAGLVLAVCIDLLLKTSVLLCTSTALLARNERHCSYHSYSYE